MIKLDPHYTYYCAAYSEGVADKHSGPLADASWEAVPARVALAVALGQKHAREDCATLMPFDDFVVLMAKMLGSAGVE